MYSVYIDVGTCIHVHVCIIHSWSKVLLSVIMDNNAFISSGFFLAPLGQAVGD